MYPQGLFGFDWFRLLVPLVVLGGTAFAVWYIHRDSRRDSRQDSIALHQLLWLQLAIALLALVGAKLFSLYVRDWHTFAPLAHELRAGWRYPGAVLAIILLGPFAIRALLPGITVGRYLDVLAIIACFGYAFLRISCLLNGCCTGGSCAGAYCLSYPPGSAVWYSQMQAGALSHPAQHSHAVLPLHLLFMAASLLIGGFLLWFDARRYQYHHYDGQVALVFLVVHEGAKAALELLREPAVMQLLYTSLAIALVAAIALLILQRRQAQLLEATTKTAERPAKLDPTSIPR